MAGNADTVKVKYHFTLLEEADTSAVRTNANEPDSVPLQQPVNFEFALPGTLISARRS